MQSLELKEFSQFCLKGRFDQFPSSRPQKFGQRIRNRPWLHKPDRCIFFHVACLHCWIVVVGQAHFSRTRLFLFQSLRTPLSIITPLARPTRIRKTIPCVISARGTRTVGIKYIAPNSPALSPDWFPWKNASRRSAVPQRLNSQTAAMPHSGNTSSGQRL